MNKKLPDLYPIYDRAYGSDIPHEQLYVYFFDAVPSKLIDITQFYDTKVLEVLDEMNFKETNRTVTNMKRYDSSSHSLFINKEKKKVIKNIDKKLNDLIQFEFLYDIEIGELEKQIDKNKIDEFLKPRKKANIQLVKSDMGHLDTEEYDLHTPPIDLQLNYGDKFEKIHNIVVEKLNQNNGKGIILFHGDPGTGKTSYIKYLTSLITEKDILFIPPSMAEMLSEPTIIPFLMDHKNSILIIEDAERVIADREGNGSPAGVSNILNLTDGILGDCLNIQIVATFNMKREKIDPALLRKGRLIVEHKFEKLTTENSNKLLKFLNKSQTVNEPMSLADIYNIDTEVIKSTNTTKIGF
jgi:ATP-dependent 26S proteasome regulatory subunit